MNRIKKHRIKEEKATTSSSNRTKEEHDLAYFIHDRVELMHQVFSVLKSKELKALAPECVRRLSIDDLQELCLEELLGISSKRLCAILDGAEPPSDTDSSSQSEQLETISLDSISSDEEILSQNSGKKKKHKHRNSKKKRRKKSKGSDDEQGESRASRAGLTVLELLELQARARAIRAQLHQEPARAAEPAAEPPSSDNDEVLIKEEPAEVVEISSDEEKPDVGRLAEQIGTATSEANETETNKKNDESQTVTKRINDLIITVPQSKPTRKIKLKRQKPTETVTREVTNNKAVEKQVAEVSNTSSKTDTTNVCKKTDTEPKQCNNVEVKNKNKKSKKKKKKVKEKEGSDEDEITIQLSDTEKMDLLEDLEAKNFDTVSSSDSESSGDDEQQNGKVQAAEEKEKVDNTINKEISETDAEIPVKSQEVEGKEVENDDIRGYVSHDNVGTVEINDLPIVDDSITSNSNEIQSSSQVDDKLNEVKSDLETDKDSSERKTDNNETSDDKAESPNLKQSDVFEIEKPSSEEKTDEPIEKRCDKTESSNLEKSDGEISDRESSEVEASDVRPEVVCISDDEGKKKKKKKKEKKSKKEKKKSGFREDLDENFHKEKQETTSNVTETIDNDDDVYEYLEISDDSSCYEVGGVSVLSKEPTAEEIEAFSAKMDEIDLDREETIPTTDVPTVNPDLNDADIDIENVSWKDRYLGSKKVKRVLTTSNILNAIRKKNRELKKKLEEAKNAEKAEKEEQKDMSAPTIEDGTIEQYETLEGSTKYVDPVKEIDATEDSKEQNENLTREMKKDAKMLLKMYKRLLKYNDVNKQKDPNKKKKKKQKKNKDKDKEKHKVA